MNLLLFVNVFVLTVFVYSQALECGIDNTSQSKDLQEIAETCAKKSQKSEDKPKKSSNSQDEDDDDSHEGTTTESSLKGKNNKRNKRDDKWNNNRKKSSREMHDTKNDNNNNNDNQKNVTDSNSNDNSTTDKDNCVVHCIFENMGMVDSEGFPVHHRVLNALMNNARGRELRDFVQDTTDECFQLMEQGSHDNPCQYSVTLVNCLAERGKSNCADWPIGNLPFLNKKN